MPYGTPQSMMYNMRGRGTDGSMIRNRSREQQFSGSGNPAMPIFNTGRMDPRQPQSVTTGVGFNPGQSGQYYGAAMPQFADSPQGGTPGTPQQYGGAVPPPQGGMSPEQARAAMDEFNRRNGNAPIPQFTPQQQALRSANIARAQGPLTPSVGSAATYNYNYNQAPGQSPFAAAIAAQHKPPMPTPPMLNS